MNRRNFFKVLTGTLIGVIAVPTVIKKVKPKTLWLAGKDRSVIIGEIPWKHYCLSYEYQLQNDPLIYMPLKKNEAATPNRS